jgi:hypothetical protein
MTDPVGVAVDDEWIYVTDQTEDIVYRLSKMGDILEPLAVGQLGATQVTVTGNAIYWVTMMGGTVMGLAK